MSNLVFLNNQNILWVSLLAFLLLCVFLWKEWQGQLSRLFLIRSLVSLVLVLALSMIFLKPSMSFSTSSNKIIILTENFQKQQLDSLKEHYKNIKTTFYKKGKALFKEKPVGDTVFILGEGIQEFDFNMLKNTKVVFLSSDHISGINKIKFPKTITIGEDFIFKGNYKSPIKGNKLFLFSEDKTALDSITFLEGTEQQFQLKTKPKIANNYVYSLAEKDTLGKLLSEDSVPFQVKEPELLNILIQNSFPTFEMKYLKNFLARQGHRVTVKNQITRGRYKYEYFNVERKPISSFSKESLRKFDLLLIDNATLNSLSSQNFTNLKNAIYKDGLGIFIQPDESLFSKGDRFQKFDFLVQNKKTGKLLDFENKSFSKYPFVIKENALVSGILFNEKAEFISAEALFGKGKIATSTLQNTYEFLLEGKTKLYQKLWTQTLNKTIKPKTNTVLWKAKNRLAFQNNPFSFLLETAIKNPTVAVNDTFRIPLINDVHIPTKWNGKTYPRYTGWQQLKLKNNDSLPNFSFFVMDSLQWKSVSSQQNIDANKRFAKQNSFKVTTQKKEQKPIKLLYFYLIALFCLGYLWLAPKLFD